jgi:protein-S-isoprenylcysteine O-methyltransferase Ste14
MNVEIVEAQLRWAGAVAGLGTLAIALAAMARAVRRPSGRVEPGARIALRLPVLAVATIGFIGAGVWLWFPLPFDLAANARLVLAALGWLVLAGACSLYLWGLRTLSAMFAPSSGFGVRLHAGHRLIEAGPYAIVRHPMYLAVMMAAIGSLFLYRTWATLAFAVMMLGLVVRARREERVLAQEFGQEWRAYAARVPAWLPRLRRENPSMGPRSHG